MRVLVDLSDAVRPWLSYLDSYLGINLDDRLSIMLYNMEWQGDDSWIHFMTQIVKSDDTEYILHELIDDLTETELSEQVSDMLNNAIDNYLHQYEMVIDSIVDVNIKKMPWNDISVHCVVEVSSGTV